ncbi:MAG: hypothetical protein GYA17_08555 [Chloroflexi bacterium]|nr:hypothetical protein [Chloroflexota bacterium]
MSAALGTEPLPTYYHIELAHAAHKLVSEVRPIQAGQQVVITGDTASDERVLNAVAGAVYTAGGLPTILRYITLPSPMLPPPLPVSQAVASADVWFDFSVAYQLYSPAYQAAIDHGCIYVCLTGMDVDMLVRTVGRVAYPPMQAMAQRVYQMSQAAESVHVTSPAGTDLWMKVDKAGDSFWEPAPATGGFPQMLGGQSGFMAYRENYEGRLVFDGALWPPAELGLLHQPVQLSLRNGLIQDIRGGGEALIFQRWLDSFHHPQAYLMDHACYGFNPGVTRPSGRILEDERVFGCMQFGIGATAYGSPAHTDGVVLNPSVWLDGVQIEDNGKYIHPELVQFCHQMGAPGY